MTERILERLEEVGGQNVKVLDSNEMWEDPTFRARFSEEIQAKGPPPRAMLFTADKLLEQLTVSEKWAMDGTHRVSPQHFSQMFLTMMKVGEKWLPAVLGLLPDHEGESYALYVKMILHSLGERSFTNPNSPFLGRVIGTGSQVQARQDNAQNQAEYDLKGKKCLKCLKRFQNGVFKKSKVIKCNGCGGFVHEKNGNGCHVIMMHEDKTFYCNICAQHAVANQSIVQHIPLHSTANQDLAQNLDQILLHIEEILPPGEEEEMSMAAELEVLVVFVFLPLLIFFLLFRSFSSSSSSRCLWLEQSQGRMI